MAIACPSAVITAWGWPPGAACVGSPRPDQRSVVVARTTQHGTVAEHGNGAVLAHRDHGGQGIVMAVAPTGRVAGAANRLNGRFRRGAGYQPHAKLPERSLGIEDGRSVDLGQRMAERGEVSGSADSESRGSGKSL